MLEAKTFELRDRATFIPLLAVSCTVKDSIAAGHTIGDEYLLGRAGYGKTHDCVIVTRLDAVGGVLSRANCEPYNWGDRTFATAHAYIEQRWPFLVSGQVIDVEYLLGEAISPKLSERVEEMLYIRDAQ